MDEYEDSDELEPIYLKGEYWFDESGDTIYADGDIGDMNHEAYVLQRLQSNLLDHFNIYPDEYYEEFDHYEDEIKQYILDESGLDENSDEYEDKSNELDDDFQLGMVNFLKERGVANAEEVVQLGVDGPNDAREYAIKNWGWSRVHGDSIEVNTLTEGTLRIVASGISNGLEEEGAYHEEDGDLRTLKAVYTISTYTGKRYEITLEDMKKGNVSGLEGAVNTNTAATERVKQMDQDIANPFYKGLMGDSYIPTFAEFWVLEEKKKKRDRCLRKADQVYGKGTSAYKSAAAVRCRQGKIWKKKS